ncbi:hypothetical protein V2J09_008426 [Rumex salicifolius]
MKQSSRMRSERSWSWAELCCLDSTCVQLWTRVVLRKWLNIAVKDSDFSADTSDDDADDAFFDLHEELPRLRRQNSETSRTQYINRKEIRMCVGTWNVGGRVPPDDLEIDEWLNISNAADVYVIGLQEIVPLNAGNVFGSEDLRPALKWENIIRGALNRVQIKRKYKSFSDPPSPTKFKPSVDAPDIEDEILLDKYIDSEEVHPVEEVPYGIYEHGGNTAKGDGDAIATDDTIIESVTSNEEESAAYIEKDLPKQFASLKGIDRLRCSLSSHYQKVEEESVPLLSVKLSKAFSGTERKDLIWPEPPLSLLAQHVLNRKRSIGRNTKSLKTLKKIRTYKSFNHIVNDDPTSLSVVSGLAKLDIEKLIQQRRSEYVRIVSKQMVGVFITIWVRKGLRKHVKNLKVSTVGVGVMGYIGNKVQYILFALQCSLGSISVSMSIYQTLFCFICTHLTSGEKDGDELKRNADVYEIQRRTRFCQKDGLPQNIHDHERIIWLGDLNYRINLPYQKTRELISKQDWTKLVERDQLKQQLKEGHAFEGWFEGLLNFPPTYKYEPDSDKYYGVDTKAGRRNPAWCDRILSFGSGIELLNYKRAELKLSDHRPVTATFMVEVEDVCPRKLQRALTFTDAEIQLQEVLVARMGTSAYTPCITRT